MQSSQYQTLDTATYAAMALLDRDAVVWKIAGPDGLTITRAKIERIYFETYGKLPALH